MVAPVLKLKTKVNAPALIVPEFYRNQIPDFIIGLFRRYFNGRDSAVLDYPFVRNVLENRLSEATESSRFVGILAEGNAPVPPRLLWQTVGMLQTLAPGRAWGTPRRVKNWIAGYNVLPTHRLFAPIDTDLLNKLIKLNYPSDALINRRVNWHGRAIGRLDMLPNNTLAIKLRLRCAVCEGAPIWIWAQPGGTAGSWAYVTDAFGNHANLRDQVYACSACACLVPQRQHLPYFALHQTNAGLI